MSMTAIWNGPRSARPVVAGGEHSVLLEQFDAALHGVTIHPPPGLAALLDDARSGDTVVVIAIDRFGRGLSGIIRTSETLTEVGAVLL